MEMNWENILVFKIEVHHRSNCSQIFFRKTVQKVSGKSQEKTLCGRSGGGVGRLLVRKINVFKGVIVMWKDMVLWDGGITIFSRQWIYSFMLMKVVVCKIGGKHFNFVREMAIYGRSLIEFGAARTPLELLYFTLCSY